MLACANVLFPPLFFNSHVYPVGGTLIFPSYAFPSSFSPSSFTSCHGHSSSSSPPPPPPDGMQSTLLVSEASVTGRIFLSSATTAALSPSVVESPLCRLLTLTHNTCACCVVAFYFLCLSRFSRPIFPGSFFFVNNIFLNGILFLLNYLFYIVLLIVIIKQMWLNSNRIK